MLRRISIEDIPVHSHAKHQGFKLPLPMMVEGPDSMGSFFREETTLSHMSHMGALFALHSPVSLGTRLKLVIRLPNKLGEGKSLKLVVKGNIASVDPEENGNGPRQVSLRLENRYFIEPESPG